MNVQHKMTVIAGGLLLIVFALPTSALTLQEKDTVARSSYQNAKSTYQAAVKTYQTARSQFLATKAKYKNNKSQENREKALTDAQNFGTRALETMEKYLLLMKTEIEQSTTLETADKTKALNEINADLTWIAAQKTEVANAETRDTLVSAGDEIAARWNSIRVETKRIAGLLLAGKINVLLSKGGEISERVGDKIETLKADGYDTQELETLQADFNEDLDTAQAAYDDAREVFLQITSLENADNLYQRGRTFINQADKAARSAYQTLSEIVRTLKKATLKKADVQGTGFVVISNGNGSVVLVGNGSVTGTTAKDAVLRVVDNGGDATVNTNAEGTKKTIDDKTTEYSGFGTVRVSGSNVDVTVISTDLDLRAEGTGTVTMRGTSGTYRVGKDGAEKPLSSTPTVIQIAQ